MACSVTVLSPQRTPLAQQALGRVCMPVARRQARATSIAALGDFDVAQTVATSVELGSAPEVSVTSVYIGLGLLLASFVATFGVAPMFRSSFKEEDTYDPAGSCRIQLLRRFKQIKLTSPFGNCV